MSGFRRLIGPARCLPAVVCLLLSGASPAAQQPAQFRAAVDTVRVDVVVTDGDGNFIDDLGPQDFTLFEDGARQQIVTVELVDLAARTVQRVDATGADADPAPEGAGVEDAVAGAMAAGAERGAEASAAGTASMSGERASDLGAVIFFIDLPGLHFRNSADFADSMQRFFARTAALDLPYAIYLVDMAGRLRELQPLTTDLETLREGARAARKTTSPIFIRDYLFNALNAGAGGAYRADRGQARGRTLYTYELLRDFVDSLAHRAGRTALVWVSTGVDLAAYENVERPYALLGQPNPTPGAVFRSYNPDLKVLDLQEQLHRAANSANVSIYSVDPSTLADFYLALGGGLKRRDGGAEDARGSSLRNAAHATGGDVFIGWTELDRVLENIERDAARFYLLSYVPPAGGVGLYHEIRVEVGRRGADVRARRGYTRYTESERLSRTVRSALDLPGTVSGFDVIVQAVRARAQGEAILVVDSAIAAQTAGGEIDGRALLLFSTVRDEDGELVAVVENQRLAPVAQGTATAGTADAPAAYWTHRAAHRLEPGEYDVSVTVLDPRSERIGAARIEVEIADTAGEWDVSDPWLMVETADGATTPVVGGSVPAGRPVFMYVEVYNGVSPEVGGRVLPFTGDEQLAVASRDERTPEAAGIPSRRGPSMPLTEAGGVHHASVPLTAQPPGTYVLDFYIDDPGAGRTRSMRLPLHVYDSER